MAATATPIVRLLLAAACRRAGGAWRRGHLGVRPAPLRSALPTGPWARCSSSRLASMSQITTGTASNWSTTRATRPGSTPPRASLGAFFEIGQLIIAVLGAMVITSEYSTGMIRTSLTAQPRRGVVYTAKAIVFTAVALVISLITAFVAFFVGQAIYSSKGVAASLFHTVTIPANANVTCNGPGRCTATLRHRRSARPPC